jgi:hypothetical protein
VVEKIKAVAEKSGMKVLKTDSPEMDVGRSDGGVDAVAESDAEIAAKSA